MTWVLFLFFSYLCGSLPFSVWIGKLILQRDIRKVGDGNPGATNVFRTGSSFWGVIALALETSKAAAPVGFAYHTLGYRGLPMILISIAPMLGHMASPFLHFRGGKALSTALGVWIGLTLWKASSAVVLFTLIGYSIFSSSGWAVMLGLSGLLIVLLAWMPDPLLLAVWVIQVVLLGWTHRADLRQGPQIRHWLARPFLHSRE